MNPQQFRYGSQNVRTAKQNGEWWLTIGVLAAAALILLLASRAVVAPTSSAGTNLSAPAAGAPAVINNHLYVPCSVSGCGPKPAVINNHLYVPCSVSGCGPKPAVINNHLYVPCSVSGCGPTQPILLAAMPTTP